MLLRAVTGATAPWPSVAICCWWRPVNHPSYAPVSKTLPCPSVCLSVCQGRAVCKLPPRLYRATSGSSPASPGAGACKGGRAYQQDSGIASAACLASSCASLRYLHLPQPRLHTMLQATLQPCSYTLAPASAMTQQQLSRGLPKLDTLPVHCMCRLPGFLHRPCGTRPAGHQ